MKNLKKFASKSISKQTQQSTKGGGGGVYFITDGIRWGHFTDVTVDDAVGRSGMA